MSHLLELRRRILQYLAALLVFSAGCFLFWEKLLGGIYGWTTHLAKGQAKVIYTAPAAAVGVSLKIALYGGLVLSLPVLLLQIWGFVSPGLYKKEKRMLLPALIGVVLLFAVGVGACLLLLPYMMKFLIQYGNGRMEALFQIDLYIRFVFQMLLVFGAVFEMPMVVYLLAKLEILGAGQMIQGGRVAVVVIFVAAAIFSPPDAFSQVIVAAPLLLLYGISIGVAYLVEGRRKHHDK